MMNRNKVEGRPRSDRSLADGRVPQLLGVGPGQDADSIHIPGRERPEQAFGARADDARPTSVPGPLGQPITLESLPPADTRRWVVRRKAEVVAAVNGGLLTVDEVCERYGLTLEEFASWQRAVDRSGMQGLRVTRIQHYRDLYERQLKY